nr:hypothetical protein [Staphylococcus saccharolyticus]
MEKMVTYIEENNIDSLSQHMIDIVENPIKEVKNQDKLKYSEAVNNYKQLLEELKLI